MDKNCDKLITTVLARGKELYRDFAWRRTYDPYAVLVSEVMLQQTQTARVERYFERWMGLFPTVDALAAASVADVLEAWQGLGYNRRALALKRAADFVSKELEGALPCTEAALCGLPGVGPATAAGVLAFAFEQPACYLETNVRTVLLHECFPSKDKVPDSELLPVLAAAAAEVSARGISARAWNYALLDYGAWLKRAFPNPSRRSAHHSKQSAYEGSHRQKRARLLEAVLAAPGCTTAELLQACTGVYGSGGEPVGEGGPMFKGGPARALTLEGGPAFGGKPAFGGGPVLKGGPVREGGPALALTLEQAECILAELAAEGFCSRKNDAWFV